MSTFTFPSMSLSLSCMSCSLAQASVASEVFLLSLCRSRPIAILHWSLEVEQGGREGGKERKERGEEGERGMRADQIECYMTVFFAVLQNGGWCLGESSHRSILSESHSHSFLLSWNCIFSLSFLTSSASH